MDAALSKVLQERERILARIGRQRSEVVVAVHGLATPIALLDRAAGLARYMRTHPALVGVAVAAVVALRTRSVLGLLTRGIGLWRVSRQLRSLLHRFGL